MRAVIALCICACLYLAQSRHILSADYYGEYFYEPDYLDSSEYQYYDEEHDNDAANNYFDYVGDEAGIEDQEEDKVFAKHDSEETNKNHLDHLDNKDKLNKKSMDGNTDVDYDYDYTYDDHEYYDDYDDHSQAEQEKPHHHDEPKLTMAGYRKKSMRTDSSTGKMMGKGGKNDKEDVGKGRKMLEQTNSKLYSSVESYELRKHIMDLIKIYKEKVENFQVEYEDDYDDDNGDFYSFYNYYDLDKNNQKHKKGEESHPTTVYFDYIDIADSLSFKKKWNGSK